MKFELSDLSPRACTIELEVNGEIKSFRLKKFSLLAQIWAREEFGSLERFSELMDPKSEINVKSESSEYTKALLKTIHYLLEDKSLFPTWESFAESMSFGPAEILNLSRAYAIVIGVSQPIVDKALEETKKKVIAKAKKSRPRGT